jgi:inosine guanosine and xanthosine phosphorylase family
MTPSMRAKLQTAAQALRRRFGAPAEFAVIFGSGLGSSVLRQVSILSRVAFSKIPFLPPVGVAGHEGEIFLVRKAKGPQAILVEGRVHYYEGYSPDEVVFAVRVLALWGVKNLLLTNASGSLRPGFRPGDLAGIADHLNLTGVNPLRGPNLDFLGPRFPELTHAYRNSFSRKVEAAARQAKLALRKGVYVGIAGPSYETDAEVRAYRRLGGDLVGMSTVLEAIAAVHAGMNVAGVTAVTNRSYPPHPAISHQLVLKNARAVDAKLAKLLLAMLEKGIR